MIREASGTEPTVYARFGAYDSYYEDAQGLIMAYRLWQGKEATTEGSGRQDDREQDYRAGTVKRIRG